MLDVFDFRAASGAPCAIDQVGALVFAGTQAINAVSSISITALYVAYSIPIGARWIWRKENGWTPGAFSLGGG
jgi:hypothetical protein